MFPIAFIIIVVMLKISKVNAYVQSALILITFHPLGEVLGLMCMIRIYRDFIVKSFQRLLFRLGISRGFTSSINVISASASHVVDDIVGR